MIRHPASPENDARRVVRLAQAATARLRALRRLQGILVRRDSDADIDRWFTECEGRRRQVQLRDLSAASAQLVVLELRFRAQRADGHAGSHIVLSGISHEDILLPDLGVSVRPRVLAIDCQAGTQWTTAAVTAFLGLLADLTALTGGTATLLFVDEPRAPQP